MNNRKPPRNPDFTLPPLPSTTPSTMNSNGLRRDFFGQQPFSHLRPSSQQSFGGYNYNHPQSQSSTQYAQRQRLTESPTQSQTSPTPLPSMTQQAQQQQAQQPKRKRKSTDASHRSSDDELEGSERAGCLDSDSLLVRVYLRPPQMLPLKSVQRLREPVIRVVPEKYGEFYSLLN